MRFPEKELYAGIRDRLLAAETESHYTTIGAVKPLMIGLYNRDYLDQSAKLPFDRPAVLVEFKSYQLEDQGGYKIGPIPVVLHVVQDHYVTGRTTDSADQAKYDKSLEYPVLIDELLHEHQILNTILRSSGVEPDHDHKNLLVHRIELVARVKVRTNKVQV